MLYDVQYRNVVANRDEAISPGTVRRWKTFFFWAKDGPEGHSQGSPGQTAFFKEQWVFSFVDIF